jgi:hypothetical protein
VRRTRSTPRWAWSITSARVGLVRLANSTALRLDHWFLPATVSAYTFPEISISNNLLRNLGIYSRLREE